MAHEQQLLVFLREIKDRPDDDLPRLVLADWLQDQGDPRGEFVHLQVMRARLREDDPQAQTLYGRERTLLRKHALTWLGPLADVGSGWTFERGFIQLELRAEPRRAPMTNLPDLSRCEAAAWVEGVTTRAKGPADLSILHETGLLGQLCWLDLSGLQLSSLGPLLRNESAGLRSLLLRDVLLNAGEVERLAETPILSRLKVLDLSGNRLRDASAFALAASAPLRNLVSLDVSENHFTNTGRDALSASFGDRVVLQRSRRDVS